MTIGRRRVYTTDVCWTVTVSVRRSSGAPIQPRSAIITLFGAFVVPQHNWIAIADIVDLLTELGLDGRSVRTAVARLKKASLLEAVERHGTPGYSATPDLLAVLERGDVRIFTSQVPADLADGWIVATFSVPETHRDQRHRLRALLSSLGFGSMGPGVWIAPRRARSDAERLLMRDGLDSYVHLLTADYVGFDTIADLTASIWSSSALESEYEAFIEHHGSTVEDWERGGENAQEAFVLCMAVLEHWRSLTYTDPGLPDEIQAGADKRTTARELFAEIGARLESTAREHVSGPIP